MAAWAAAGHIDRAEALFNECHEPFTRTNRAGQIRGIVHMLVIYADAGLWEKFDALLARTYVACGANYMPADFFATLIPPLGAACFFFLKKSNHLPLLTENPHAAKHGQLERLDAIIGTMESQKLFLDANLQRVVDEARRRA